MSAFPNFSNISQYIKDNLKKRKGTNYNISKLNPWVRVTAGAGPGGLVLVSNPDFNLFKAAGSAGTGIYGNDKLSGTLGTTWDGTPVNAGEGQGYRPAPIIPSLEIDEGAGNLSRKATFSITAHSKEQMELLSKYFLEPGYSIFIEWGWNTDAGASGLQTLNKENISKFQSFVNTNKIRESAGGEYDNYLGMITGGGIALNNDAWTLNVNCTGYVELPAYLMASETGEQKENELATFTSAEPYGQHTIRINNNPKSSFYKSRWMLAFNELPKTRKTDRVKELENSLGSKQENFINFDKTVTNKLNSTTEGGWLGKDTKEIGGTKVKFPKGTKIVSEQKFIKFSALMEIFSSLGVSGYRLASDPKKTIKFKINTKDTICSAFEHIYSTKIDKLFIPNPKGPKFKLGAVSSDSKISDIITNDPNDLCDNSVKKADGGTVEFPQQISTTISYPLSNDVTYDSGKYGYLDDLYVNFNFAKNILETEQFFVKDAMYQILNGISSAVNGMWDFQIQETEVKDANGNSTGTTELKVVELGNVGSDNVTDIYEFNLIGTDSIFIDSSFDMDLSGGKMAQVVGRRLGAALNGDAQDIPKTLFSDEKDLLEVEIVEENKPGAGGTTANTTRDEDQIKEDNLQILLGNISFLPRVELTKWSSVAGDLYNSLYVGSFNDSSIFNGLRLDKKLEQQTVSPLLPINFSFSIHGVSGIKRGDKFRVNGIPEKYKDGFFQVLSVKHTIDGSTWKTEVTGGYRRL